MLCSMIAICLLAGTTLADTPQPVPYGDVAGEPVPLRNVNRAVPIKWLRPAPLRGINRAASDDTARLIDIPENVARGWQPLDGNTANRKLYAYNFPANTYRLQSPNYGKGNYPNNLYYGFVVRGLKGQTITIRCDPFNIADSESCLSDYLHVNGKRYCGSNPFTHTSRELTIIFKTDKSITSTGFSCSIDVPPCQHCGVQQTSRVVGGLDAKEGHWPWQAGLVNPGSNRTFCGGSVINDRYVLTAAHCTANKTADDIQVLLGDQRINITDSGEQRFSVTKITDHPDYSGAVGGWDVSLLRLDRRITFSDTISPVCLAEAGQTYAGVTAIASGYGRVGATSPQADVTQYVELPVWKQDTCRTKWNFLKDSMLCAGGSDAGGTSVCMGDSGGPLVTQVNDHFRLIGTVSFGNPCAIAGWPDVFARVSETVSWIHDNTEDAQYCEP